MSNDFVKNGYNIAAVSYDAKRNQEQNLKYLKKLNSLLSPNATILDLGCGAGKPVDSFLTNKKHKVIGIDISEKMIELAKENVPDATYKNGDISKLKKNEYHVDAVVSFYAIIHIKRETHLSLLKTINSFLPLGGLLLISMGSTDWEGTEAFHGAQMYWSHYDAKTNHKLVEESGFEILIDEIDGPTDDQHQFILAKKVL